MGYIDKVTYNINCPNCGAQETVKILDKGNRYSGSDWQSGPSLSSFNVSWTQADFSEPEISTISCKQCGTKPEIDSKFSL